MSFYEFEFQWWLTRKLQRWLAEVDPETFEQSSQAGRK